MTPPESLTEEELSDLTRAATFADAPWCRAVAKLLRIHDRLQGEVRELRGPAPRPLHFEFISGEDFGRLEQEAIPGSPEAVSKPLVRKLARAFLQALAKLNEARQSLEAQRFTPPRR